MTWIVKATGGHEYCCHPMGEIWAPDLADAWRYKSEKQARRVAGMLNREMKDGLPYRVVRLRTKARRLATAVADFCAIQDEFLKLHRSTKTKVPKDWLDAYRAMKRIAAALSVSNTEGSNGS